MKSHLREVLEKIKRGIERAQHKGYDLSYEFGPYEESGDEFKVQQDLRLETRSLCTIYHDVVAWSNSALGLKGNNEVLTAMDDILTLFGDHPFHRVIEGRIAIIVQTELGVKGNLD